MSSILGGEKVGFKKRSLYVLLMDGAFLLSFLSSDFQIENLIFGQLRVEFIGN